MEMKEAIRTVIKELIIPELGKVREDNQELKTILSLTNRRLDDVNNHLLDQSRRIDAVRTELTQRMDALREELTGRIDENNRRMDRLYDVVVRRDEHFKVEERVAALERDFKELKERLAA
jgi:predicted nuclease with TOPRIM domain